MSDNTGDNLNSKVGMKSNAVHPISYSQVAVNSSYSDTARNNDSAPNAANTKSSFNTEASKEVVEDDVEGKLKISMAYCLAYISAYGLGSFSCAYALSGNAYTT